MLNKILENWFKFFLHQFLFFEPQKFSFNFVIVFSNKLFSSFFIWLLIFFLISSFFYEIHWFFINLNFHFYFCELFLKRDFYDLFAAPNFDPTKFMFGNSMSSVSIFYLACNQKTNYFLEFRTILLIISLIIYHSKKKRQGKMRKGYMSTNE